MANLLFAIDHTTPPTESLKNLSKKVYFYNMDKLF